MTYKIQFGTDGWRALIARDYTVDNVLRVAAATLHWMKQKGFRKVVIGHDCRFGGQMFVEETAALLAAGGVECLVAKGFVSTPMVSCGVVHHGADLGIVITASHNPPAYNGYKLKSSFGAPTLPSDIAEIEQCIADEVPVKELTFQEAQNLNKIRYVDLESEYLERVHAHFNIEAIRNQFPVAYDAMYGAGQRIMKMLFPDMKAFHCENNPGFNETPPEPITRNLEEIMSYLSSHPGIYTGIANDGDADRVAFLNDRGEMVDSHHILLLLLHYLVAYKKQTGKIVVSFSVTNKLKKLAAHYGLECITTKIGFKYIAEYMVQGEVLVGGEESGGLAIKGHIPERDGVWIALTLLQFMAETGKSLDALVAEVYSIVGPFYYDRIDLQLQDTDFERVKLMLLQSPSQWGDFIVRNREDLDGQKYYFDHDAWLMIRTSGTEPVLRIYAQGRDQAEVQAIHHAARAHLNI